MSKSRDCVPFRLKGSMKNGVLLIHGFTGSPGELRPLGEYLNKIGFNVKAIILPGHCASPEDLEKTRWEEWANAVKEEYQAFRDELGVDPFVSGLSLGGALILYLAEELDIPAIAPLAAPVELPSFVKLAGFVSKFKRFVRAKEKVKYEIDHFHYDRVPLKAVIEVVKFVEVVRKNLSKITSPILIIQGKLDEVISPKNAKIIFNNVSSTEKRILWLVRTHHVIPLDVEREKAFREIGEFFKNHSG